MITPEITLAVNILTLVAVVAVGFILKNQIKSQSDLLNHYKNYVQSIDPSKLMSLKNAEMEQLKINSSITESDLKDQLYEMANYIDSLLTMLENSAKYIEGSDFKKKNIIEKYLPKSNRLLEEIHTKFHSTPNA